MINGSRTSRRSFFVSAAASFPACVTTSFNTVPLDAELIHLGHLFQVAATELDRAIDGRANFEIELFERLDTIKTQILSKNAVSLEGLRVKARVACWVRLGDLEAVEGASMSVQMAISIVRDLIRAFDPHLENPGALRRLLPD